MAELRRLFWRCVNTFRPDRGERDLSREVASHLALLEDEYRRRGLSPAQAARAARLALGGLDQTKEGHRDARSVRWLSDLRQDVRYAVRGLVRAPGFTLVTLLTLALGIGANTAIFSVVDAVLLRPSLFPDANRLVRIDELITRLPLRGTPTGVELAFPIAVPELAQSRAFSSIGTYWTSGLNLGEGGPERLRAAAVTTGFFPAVGIRLAKGRAFTDDDLKQSNRIAVISHRLWERRFSSDDAVVGRTIALNGRDYVVSGVMPPQMDFPAASDVWIPNTAERQIAMQVAFPVFIGRLAPGVSLAAAREEVLRLTADGALTKRDSQLSALRVTPLQQSLVEHVRPILLLVASAALLVLMVACANIASLLLTRVAAREREFAIRRALGASTRRLARQVLGEGLLLAIAAGIAAIPVGYWTLQAVLAFVPEGLYGVRDIALNVRAFGSLAFFSLVTAVLLGMPSSIAVQRRGMSILRGVSATVDRFGRRFRSALVVAEIALAFTLLVGAATVTRTLAGLLAVDLGARNDQALVMEVTLPRATYATVGDIRAFFDQLRDTLRGTPGIEAIGATNHLPGSLTVETPVGKGRLEGYVIPEGEAHSNTMRLSATPGYFDALGIDVLAGRPFTDADRSGTAPVAVVSEQFARAFHLQPVEVIGRRVNVGFAVPRFAEVVGVVRDVRMEGPESGWQPAVYVPFSQIPLNGVGYVVVKAGARPETRIATIRTAVARIDPSLPLYNVRRFADVRADYLAERQLAMTTMSAFGSLAFGLAALGLYGIMSYLVRLRTREIGIRIAIGASRAAVQRQVIASSSLHAAAGLAIGISLAVGLWKLVTAHVPGVGQVDAWTLAVLSGTVLLVAISACWLPARRAARIDPLVALRSE